MKKPRHTTDGEPPADDLWEASAPKPIGSTGQHEAYWVLPEEERAKGFVRPVRRSYRHVGPPMPNSTLRDLTAEEVERHSRFGYVKFEEYPESESSVTGRYWTQTQLDSIGGCGSMTTMTDDLAETFARDPSYYGGGTFCCNCRKHLPLEEFVWEGTNERVGS